jgi:hypothetical protein
VIQAPGSGALFIGYESGSLYKYDPTRPKVTHIHGGNSGGSVLALATSHHGDKLVAIWEPSSSAPIVSYWRSEGDRYSYPHNTPLHPPNPDVALVPLIDESDQDTAVCVFSGHTWNWYEIPSLLPRLEAGASEPAAVADVYLHLRVVSATGPSVFVFVGNSVRWGLGSIHIPWQPALLACQRWTYRNISWLVVNHEHVELCGIDGENLVHWSAVVRAADGSLSSRTISATTVGGYRGVAMWKMSRVAAVTFSNQVQWLYTVGQRLEEYAPPMQLNSIYRPVGCFLSAATDELIVVMGSGEVFHVPLPA